MTDLLKKIFTVGVVTTTIFWSVGLFSLLPSVANAADMPNLTAGQMVKVIGRPTIYVVNSAKQLMAIPTGDVFKSWNVDNSYGRWTGITQAQYDLLPGANVQPFYMGFRAGSYVVKRESSDKLYVVQPGNVLVPITSAAATSLYGTLKNTVNMFTVALANWGSTYTVLDDAHQITSAVPFNGYMWSVNGVKYTMLDGNVMQVTAAGASANGLKAVLFHTQAASIMSGLPTGATIDGALVALTDRTQTGVANSNPVTATTGATTISLSGTQPLAATLVSDNTAGVGAQALAPVLSLNFTAPNDGDAVITGVSLKRSGISADADVANMYLYDGDTKLAGNPSVASTMITFTNSSGLFTVSKGSTKTIVVKMDLRNATAAGKTLTFSLAANTDVTVKSGSVTGNFPLTGNTFTTALVTSDLGRLTFTSVTPAAAGTVDPGTASYEIWRMTAADSDQDVEIRKMVFTIVGSVNVGDLQNFSLWDGATQVGTTVVNMAADKSVTFDLSAAPKVITKGQTKNLSLKVDVVAGTTRSFRATIQNGSDILTYDKAYNVFLKTNGTDSFTTLQPIDAQSTAVNFTVNSGSLTQTLAPDAPTGNIADGSTNITLAKFLWKANGEDVKISTLYVSSTAAVLGVANTARILHNARLLVNGSQVGTTIADLTTTGLVNTGWNSFGNSFIIKAGTSAVVTIVADTTATATLADDTYVVGLSTTGVTNNAQGVVSMVNITTVNQNGNTLTVKGGTVSVTLNSAFGDKSAPNPTGPINASQVKVASLSLTAGAGESVDVSQITLSETANTCVGTYLQNLTLKDSTGKQLGTTIANPSIACTTANTFVFNISPAVVLAPGQQYVVDVYADLKVALTATSLFNVPVGGVIASGHDTGTTATSAGAIVALQKQYISNAGNLTVQVDSDTPTATNLLLGATDQVLGKYRISASSTEAVNVTQFVVSAIFPTAATSGTYKNIRLFNDATGLQVGTAVTAFSSNSTTGTTTYEHAIFSGLTLQIPKGQSITLDVKADLATFEDLGVPTTGETSALVVLKYYYGLTSAANSPITATGASSGTSLTAVVMGTNSVSTFVGAPGAYTATTTAYRAKLTTAWASDTPSGAASPSGAQVVGKFIITNLANAGSYAATVSYINFNLSSSISQANALATTRALTVYKDSLSTTAVATTNFPGGNAGGTTFGNTIVTSWTNTVEISSGASKTFYVTLDTTDAASTKSLSIRIPSAGVVWSDGISSNLTAMGSDLPLVYKTFTY